MKFGKKEEIDEEIRDLKPENKKKRKEPPKPWGKKERWLVFLVFATSVVTAGVLSLSSVKWKMPGLPKIAIPKFNFLGEETIVVGNGVSVGKKDAVVAIFNNETKNLSGVYGLYVIELDNGVSYGVNENRVMQAASLIKLPVMLYALGKVDDSDIEAMGMRSDNNVFNKLVAKFGEDTLSSYIKSLGMNNTSIKENKTTPKEMGDLLKKIYDEDNKKIMSYLTDTAFEDFLPKEIEDVVSHKYGRETHVINDAGIVFSDPPFIIVIMTEGIVDSEAEAAIPSIANKIHEAILN